MAIGISPMIIAFKKKHLKKKERRWLEKKETFNKLIK